MFGFVDITLPQAIHHLETAPFEGYGDRGTDYDGARYEVSMQYHRDPLAVLAVFRKANGHLRSRILDALYCDGAGPPDPTMINLAMKSSDAALRCQAVGCLQCLIHGPKPGPFPPSYITYERGIILNALADSHPEIREVAARKLTYFPWDKRIERAVKRLRNDANYLVRFEALHAYHKMSKPSEPIPWDIDFLYYPVWETWHGPMPVVSDPPVSYMDVGDIELLIGKLPAWEKPKVRRALKRAPSQGRIFCLESLRKANETDRAHLSNLATADKDPNVRQLAYMLFSIGHFDKNLPLLLKGLKDPTFQVRLQVQGSLCQDGSGEFWVGGAKALLQAEPNVQGAESIRKRIRDHQAAN